MFTEAGLSMAGQALGLVSSAKALFGGSKDEGDSMKSQYAWNALSTLNTPMFQVRGLRKAGLNPMLAVGKGISSAPTVTASPGADTQTNTARSLAAASIANQVAQAKLYTAQAQNVEADTQDKLLKPGETTARTKLINAQAATEAWGPENKKWATELLSAQYGKTVAEKDAIAIWQRKLIEAQTVNYAETSKLIHEQFRSAKTKADLDEAFMKLERIIAMGSEGIGAVSGAVSSAGALKRALDAAKPRTTTRSGSRSRSKNQESWDETTTTGSW